MVLIKSSGVAFPTKNLNIFSNSPWKNLRRGRIKLGLFEVYSEIFFLIMS